MINLAFLSVHGCPVARLGEKDTGGMNVYILRIAKELGRLGNHVDVFTRCHDCNEPPIIELGNNSRVIHVKAGPYSSNKQSLHSYIPEYLGNLYQFQDTNQINYDIVHSHYWLSGWAGMEISRSWNVPHVVTFHTLAKIKLQAKPEEQESQIRIITEGEIIQSADGIVVSTEQERRSIYELYTKPNCDTSVFAPGVDHNLFRPRDKALAKKMVGIPEGNVVLSVGRMEPLKGFDILLKALALIKHSSDTKLVIVGGSSGWDPEVERLNALASQLGVRDRVLFTGPIDHSELPTYYNAADVFALPSFYESFGLSALEAMACGIPVVASEVGGLKTFIDHSKNGLLIPKQSPELFAQSLDLLLSEKPLREFLGKAAREKAKTMDWGKTATNLDSLYRSILASAWGSAAGD